MKDVFSILIESMFFKYFKISGRASRKEYLIFYLVCSILKYFHFIFISFQWGFIYIIFILIPTISISFRRLHDFNFNGIIILLLMVTCIFFKIFNDNISIYFMYIVELLLILIPGTSGSNKYGEPPK
jgi:uncharacterized membrane protein YhaH (DUF805 family)